MRVVVVVAAGIWLAIGCRQLLGIDDLDGGASDARIDGAPGGDAPAIDADPTAPDAVECGQQCLDRGGTCDGNTCRFDCDQTDSCAAMIECPAGIPCAVSCTAADACGGGIDCSAAATCDVTCSDVGTCNNPTTCGDGPCTVECSGGQSCTNGVQCGGGPCRVTCVGLSSCVNGVTCASSCACDVMCVGQNACENGYACSSPACDVGAGCSSGVPGCDTCP